MTEKPKRIVGAFLTLGILFLPFIFAWALLWPGYSLRARIVGFGWLALFVAIGLAASPRQSSPPRQYSAVSSSQATDTAYVNVMETEERASPGGAVVNRVYRGQRLQIYAIENGWARVSPDGFDPRWIRQTDLSERPPAAPPEASPAADPRLAALPNVGEYGHTERDVAALRAAALELLNSGECSRIEDANQSVNVAGVYYINCGEATNRFFRMRDGAPRFCGRSAASC